VLQFGEIADPEPANGEVRIRLTLSGVNPGDTKKRKGWLGSSMVYPRVIPHSDGAGIIDAVGLGVPETRIGERVWVWGAQSYRPFGTAAQWTVVPEHQAVALPDDVSDEMGACLGIPGITAHRCVFRDGPVTGKIVVVHGVLGAVGSLAAQLARIDGASVIGTVRHSADIAAAQRLSLTRVVALDGADPVAEVREIATAGVDRLVEVALSENADFDAEIAGMDAVITAYGTREDRTTIPFWPLLFSNVTLRLLGSDDFPADAKQAAAQELTDAAARGELSIHVAARFPLNNVAGSHDAVDAGIRGRVLVDVGHPGDEND
jgi:NADPH2:quinone reductase